MEKKQPLQKMLLGKLDTCLQKIKARSMFVTLYKYQYHSNWIKDLKIMPKTVKLVQKRVGNTLEVIVIGKDFLSRTQVAQQLRERIHKWDYMELKSFCVTKETISKLEKPPTEWEKIFGSYTSDKKLITRIHQELKKLNLKSQ
jgi:hypothetical protein